MNKGFENVATQFANLMIEKIESLSLSWEKPWFHIVNNSQNFLAQNLSGRIYQGGNAFLLLFVCEKYSYQTPVFLTFNQAKAEKISVAGQKGFPVYYIGFLVVNRETGEKISFDTYKELSQEEQKEYKVISYDRYTYVFNLDQTNFSEVYPERWEKLKAKFDIPVTPETPEHSYKNQILDNAINTQSWVCPIYLREQDKAYHTRGENDIIVVPQKHQFKDGESFYSTLLHEMAHSTGEAHRLNRDKNGIFGDPKYGKEELIAEFSAALAGLMMGISSGIREENAAYIQGWIRNIKQDPKYLITVLNDSIKAVKYMADNLKISFAAGDQPEEDPEAHKLDKAA